MAAMQHRWPTHLPGMYPTTAAVISIIQYNTLTIWTPIPCSDDCITFDGSTGQRLRVMSCKFWECLRLVSCKCRRKYPLSHQHTYNLDIYKTTMAAVWKQNRQPHHLRNIIERGLNANTKLSATVSMKQQWPWHLWDNNGRSSNAKLLATSSWKQHRPQLKCNNNTHGIYETTTTAARMQDCCPHHLQSNNAHGIYETSMVTVWM